MQLLGAWMGTVTGPNLHLGNENCGMTWLDISNKTMLSSIHISNKFRWRPLFLVPHLFLHVHNSPNNLGLESRQCDMCENRHFIRLTVHRGYFRLYENMYAKRVANIHTDTHVYIYIYTVLKKYCHCRLDYVGHRNMNKDIRVSHILSPKNMPLCLSL